LTILVFAGILSVRKKGQQLETTIVTTENYLEVLDSKNAMETLELVIEILDYHKENYLTFDSQILEKPWKWAEYWIPTLNGNLSDLSGDLTEYSH
jgi:hypothetical protein